MCASFPEMDSINSLQAPSSNFWYLRKLKQPLLLIILVIIVHYCKEFALEKPDFYQFYPRTEIDFINPTESKCDYLVHENRLLWLEIKEMKQKLSEIESWKTHNIAQETQNIIEENLNTFYMDQIGFFDYAAEYAGGSVLDTPNTTPYPAAHSLRLLGAFGWLLDPTPKLIIQPTTFPGQCFPFYGSKGRILVKLGRPIIITHVSLEHMKFANKSAPKEFQVLGLNESNEVVLGNFTYDVSGRAVQTFSVIPENKIFTIVELRILSNYGNDEFTCVYRFRVHSLL